MPVTLCSYMPKHLAMLKFYAADSAAVNRAIIHLTFIFVALLSAEFRSGLSTEISAVGLHTSQHYLNTVLFLVYQSLKYQFHHSL